MAADISKCSNSKCNLRIVCYRYRMKPSPHQSYNDFGRDESGKCEFFLEIGDRTNVQPSETPIIHVMSRANKWKVHKSGSKKAAGIFTHREQAYHHAMKLNCTVVVHKKDGSVEFITEVKSQ